MCDCVLSSVRRVIGTRALPLLAFLALPWLAQAAEPEALNPFGPVKTERDDAVPGYVELSDGKVFAGNVYMTRDKRIKLWDEKLSRQREVPLQKVKEIECKVKKEWMEKEWRFKELALDEKMYTGRSYPSREYDHVVTLSDGRKLSGQLSEIIHVQPYIHSPEGPSQYRPNVAPDKFLLHKRDKGEINATLKSLVYVKRIKLGAEAYKEGKDKVRRLPAAEEKRRRGGEGETGTNSASFSPGACAGFSWTLDPEP